MLAIAAIAVVIGLFVTRYQPPRAHVLTVDGESHQARDIVDRGAYLAFFEGGAGSISDIARETVDMLIEEAALRSQAEQLVGPVTEADIERELLLELELIVEEPEPVPAEGDEEDADATATPEATATTEVDAQEFADALTDFLRDADLDRGTFELIVEARIYRERLQEHFETAVGESGPQISLQRIRVSTQPAADSVIEELDGGADFATLAADQSVAEEDGDGGDVGWTALELLDEDVRAAVEGLSAGEHSATVAAGVFFEVYRVAEVVEDREYEGSTASDLATLQFDDWLESAVASIEVERDLSADEESWINDHVLAAVSARLGS